MIFEEVKDKYHLRNNVFPHAAFGVKLLGFVKKLFVTLIILTLLYVGALLFLGPRNNGPQNKEQNITTSKQASNEQKGILDNIITSLGGDANNVNAQPSVSKDTQTSSSDTKTHLISFDVRKIVTILLKIAWLFEGLLALAYLLNLLKRQRLYERNVLKNDLQAIKLKKRILKNLKIREQKNSIESRINKRDKRLKNSRDADSSDLGATVEETYTLEALEQMLNITVLVNTRQNSNHIVETIYNILVSPPESTGGQSELEQKWLGKLPDTASKATGYKVYFGDRRLTSEGSYYFQAIGDRVKDPYYFGDELTELKERKEAFNYEHTMPYRSVEKDGKTYIGLKDHSSENEKRKREAKRWADNQIDVLNEMLRGNGIKAIFDKNEPQATTAEFYFNIPEEVNVKGIDRAEKMIAEKIDEKLQCNGTTLSLGLNNAFISIPLPNGQGGTADYRQMINNEDVLRRAFG